MDNFKEIYRIQGSEKNNPFLNTQCPIRRVVVSDTGKIKLNPDSQHFIYFSRTKNHHSYYLYNKVLKIICKEIDRLKKSPISSKLNIPDDFRAFRYYSHLNVEDIKRVTWLLTNYSTLQEIELVRLKQIPAFSELFEYCATKNHQKNFGKSFPEVSDVSTFGGAYGINDAWLELLKACTVSTETANIKVTDVLEELLQCKHIIKISDQRLKSILTCNEALFHIIDHITYKELLNPDYIDKNTPNNITHLLEEIEEHKIYSPKLKLSKRFFAEKRKEFKDEYHESLEMIK